MPKRLGITARIVRMMIQSERLPPFEQALGSGGSGRCLTAPGEGEHGVEEETQEYSDNRLGGFAPRGGGRPVVIEGTRLWVGGGELSGRQAEEQVGDEHGNQSDGEGTTAGEPAIEIGDQSAGGNHQPDPCHEYVPGAKGLDETLFLRRHLYLRIVSP